MNTTRIALLNNYYNLDGITNINIDNKNGIWLPYKTLVGLS